VLTCSDFCHFSFEERNRKKEAREVNQSGKTFTA
jgi:hypothetical protein